MLLWFHVNTTPTIRSVLSARSMNTLHSALFKAQVCLHSSLWEGAPPWPACSGGHYRSTVATLTVQHMYSTVCKQMWPMAITSRAFLMKLYQNKYYYDSPVRDRTGVVLCYCEGRCDTRFTSDWSPNFILSFLPITKVNKGVLCNECKRGEH